MGRQKKHGEHTREALLQAAEALLADGGEQALSVRAVAERVGTSTRAVYSVFGSKDGLLSALGQHGFELLSAVVDELPPTDDPIADIVEGGVMGFRRWWRRNPRLFRLAFDHLVVAGPGGVKVSQAGLAALGRLKLRVQRASDAGLLGGCDVDEVTAQIEALCEGLTIVEGRHGPLLHSEPEEIWREALRALLDGLRGATSAPLPREGGAGGDLSAVALLPGEPGPVGDRSSGPDPPS
ncbi:MAG TPA: TetR/AcrR family transcriptional regulator [Actinomycetota bacterium]